MHICKHLNLYFSYPAYSTEFSHAPHDLISSYIFLRFADICEVDAPRAIISILVAGAYSLISIVGIEYTVLVV
jgi:hypothetical protein